MRVPGEGRRQRLRLIVKVQGGEITPGLVAAEKFHEPGFEHQPKDQKSKNVTGCKRRLPRLDSPPRMRDKQNRRETGLEKESIPLEQQEVLSDIGNREIE